MKPRSRSRKNASPTRISAERFDEMGKILGTVLEPSDRRAIKFVCRTFLNDLLEDRLFSSSPRRIQDLADLNFFRASVKGSMGDPALHENSGKILRLLSERESILKKLGLLKGGTIRMDAYHLHEDKKTGRPSSRALDNLVHGLAVVYRSRFRKNPGRIWDAYSGKEKGRFLLFVKHVLGRLSGELPRYTDRSIDHSTRKLLAYDKVFGSLIKP